MVGTVVVGDVEYTPEIRTRARSSPSRSDGGHTGESPRISRTFTAVERTADPGERAGLGRGLLEVGSAEITTPSLTMAARTDRNAVVLPVGSIAGQRHHGRFRTVFAIENLTGFAGCHAERADGPRGHRVPGLVSVTVINNERHRIGIYTCAARYAHGEQSTTQWPRDLQMKGSYVGGCYPCRTHSRRGIAERNIGAGIQEAITGGELSSSARSFGTTAGALPPARVDVEPSPDRSGRRPSSAT